MKRSPNHIFTKTLTACAVAWTLSMGSSGVLAADSDLLVEKERVENLNTTVTVMDILAGDDPTKAWQKFLLDRTAYSEAGTAVAQNNSLTILPAAAINRGPTTRAVLLEYFWVASAQSETGSVLAQNNRFDVRTALPLVYGAAVATKGTGENVTAAANSNAVNVNFEDVLSRGEVVGGYVGMGLDSELIRFSGATAQANDNTVTVNTPELANAKIIGGEINASNPGAEQTLEANANRVTIIDVGTSTDTSIPKAVVSKPFVAGAYINGLSSNSESLNVSHIRAHDNTVELYDAVDLAFGARIEYSDDEIDYDVSVQNNRLFAKAEGNFGDLVSGFIDIAGVQGQISASGNTLMIVGAQNETSVHHVAAACILADFDNGGSIVASGNTLTVNGVQDKTYVAQARVAYIVTKFIDKSGSIVASGNRLDVSLMEAGSLYGVQVSGQNVDSLIASDNHIEVRDSNVGSIYGIRTTSAQNTELSNNTIVIDHTAVAGVVVGLRVEPEQIQRSLQQTGVQSGFSNNHIYIVNNSNIGSDPEGNDDSGNVYLISSAKIDSATHNSITLIDSTVRGIVSVTRMSSQSKSALTTASNNRLNFSGTNSIGAFVGFDTLTLTVGSQNIGEDAQPVLTLTGANTNTTLKESDQIVVYVPQGLDSQDYQLISVAKDNTDSLNLKGATLTVQTPFYTQTGQLGEVVLKSDAQQPESAILTTQDAIVQETLAQAPKVVNGNAKTLAETLLGTVAFVQQGAEFIADDGLAAMDSVATADTLTAFGAMHGGTNKYLTGSDVEVDGVTLATGIATKVGDHTLATFVEAGWAESDSHVAGTKAEGDHDYFGVGVAARMHLTDSAFGDMSLRLGRSTTKYQGVFATDAATYDSSVYYATAHVGIGLDMPITDNWTANVYGRYSLSFIDGDKVTLAGSGNAVFDMSSTVTHAVRVGTRIKGEVTEHIAVNAGLAYEHVFNGKASSSVSDVAIDEPALKGDAAIVEFGLTMRSSATSPWSVNFGAKGYAGDRQGVSGNLSATYRF